MHMADITLLDLQIALGEMVVERIGLKKDLETAQQRIAELEKTAQGSADATRLKTGESEAT
jgi:hypothetical protein